MTERRITTRAGRLMSAISLATVLSIGAVACSDDQAQDIDEPEIQREIEPARGAADGVVDQSEDGKDLDENLNVPGTDTADEVSDE